MKSPIRAGVKYQPKRRHSATMTEWVRDMGTNRRLGFFIRYRGWLVYAFRR